ncbi:MAG: hypothetical protein R6X10_09315 [Desulfobacterales bacterium]
MTNQNINKTFPKENMNTGTKELINSIKKHSRLDFQHKIIFTVLLLLMAACFAIQPPSSLAELSPIADTDLDNVTGQAGFSEFTIDANTARFFFDIHIETYTEIESLKLGYSPKTDTGIKNDSYVFGAGDSLTTTKYNGGVGTTDNNYASYNGITGPQGTGQNQNFHDWDVNWENVQLGASEEQPMMINGLILKVEFDDINSSNKKIQKIVFGTNDMQGYMKADMNRTTGMVNPMTAADTTLHAMGTSNPVNSDPILLKRDPFLSNYQDYIFNAEDNDTGFWMILNFGAGPNGETDHIGWEIVSGYDERALDFSYTTGIDNLDLSGYR